VCVQGIRTLISVMTNDSALQSFTSHLTERISSDQQDLDRPQK
jgi:hypothetical protein